MALESEKNVDPTTGEIAKAIKGWRVYRGLSLSDLAKATGIDKSNLSRIESAKAPPSLSTLRRLSTALATPLTSLIEPFYDVDVGIHFLETLPPIAVESDAVKGLAPAQRAFRVYSLAFRPYLHAGDLLIVDQLEKPRLGDLIVGQRGPSTLVFKVRLRRESIAGEVGTYWDQLAPTLASKSAGLSDAKLLGIVTEVRRGRDSLQREL